MSDKRAGEREPLFHLSRRHGISWWQAWGIRELAFVLGMLVCGVVAFLLIEKLQQRPERIGDFYYAFIKGAFGTQRKFWKFLKNIAILQCIALALTPAFRMHFWNTGGEGQTLVGVLACIAVDFYLGGTIPEPLLLTLMLLASLLAGALWGLLPAVCRAQWGTNETLFTLMMNYVAIYLVGFFLEVWVTSGSGVLPQMKTGKLPTVGNNSYLLIILIVLALTVFLYIYLNYTKHGYEISVVGESERTAKYVGIKVSRVIIRTMLLSGAICGLTGMLLVGGTDHTLTTSITGGRGFTAVMVAWLAKFNPIWMILTSFLLVFLQRGASEISTVFGLNQSYGDILTGIILFFIVGSEFFIQYKINFRHAAGKEEAHV